MILNLTKWFKHPSDGFENVTYEYPFSPLTLLIYLCVERVDFRKSGCSLTSSPYMMSIPIYSFFIRCSHSLCRGKFGHRFCPFRYSVFRELTRQHEPYRCLDLTRGESRLLVVCGKLASLASDTTEDVVDEGIHYGHSLLADAGIGMNLFQHLVNIR